MLERFPRLFLKTHARCSNSFPRHDAPSPRTNTHTPLVHRSGKRHTTPPGTRSQTLSFCKELQPIHKIDVIHWGTPRTVLTSGQLGALTIFLDIQVHQKRAGKRYLSRASFVTFSLAFQATSASEQSTRTATTKDGVVIARRFPRNVCRKSCCKRALLRRLEYFNAKAAGFVLRC